MYSNSTESSDATFPGELEISCSNSIDTTIIEVNNNQYESLDHGTKSKKYQLSIDKEGHLEVHVVPCAGKLELVILDQWWSKEPLATVSQLTDGALQGIVPNARAGSYYIIICLLYTSPSPRDS